MPTRLINVSNRLPVTVGEDGRIEKSSGGLVAALEGLGNEQFELAWIGWPGGGGGAAAGSDDPQRQTNLARTLVTEHGLVPVFLSPEQQRGFYEGFSNSSIWPLLHYMPSKFRYEPQWWDHYLEVNRAFCRKVVDHAQEGDCVWVHDYQLMLLPAMLRETMPSLRIGFFLHTPFPSYEVIRCNPKRNELVAGLLGADLVGFHTFGYMRHFRSSVLRLLGTESELTRIRHDAGQVTKLGVFPIGINAGRCAEELTKRELAERVEHFRWNFGGKRIVLSVERLDYTKGILHRLDAIDLFLARHPEQRDEIKFIFVSVPSRQEVEEYQSLREEVEYRVGRINGRYTTLSNAPVHFMHGSVGFGDLAALYAMADVGLVTPLIDGMNLVAKEYVACQRSENPGVLVLSEFAGAAEELFNALIVNPYDASAVAEAIETALEMPLVERQRRMAPMAERVRTYDAATWARSFITELSQPATVNGKEAHATCPGDARRAMREALSRGGRVAMFLDYDGTLREIERDPAAARPNAAVISLLERLAATKNLDVTIISGRTPQDLESFLGRYQFGMVAEHGAFLRHPGHRGGEWEQLDRNASYAWMDEILSVLSLYVESTPGSFVERKRTSLVWHFRRADPEFGEWKARQLADELAAMLANDPVQVRHGRKIVEVTASQVSKGAAVMHVLADQTYDAILCAGDDTTDESMFRLDVKHLITIKVGDRESHAQFRLPSPAALRRFLEEAVG